MMANPADWCTLSWAAERCGLHERQVRRLIEEGVLHKFYPRKGRKETARWGAMLHVAQVERYAEARKTIGKVVGP